MCLFVWRKNRQGFRQFGEVSIFLSSLNRLYRPPNLFLFPPLRCSRTLPNFSCETHPDNCSCHDLQKNHHGSRQFGGVSKKNPQGNGLSRPKTCCPDTLWYAPVHAGFFLLILLSTPAFVFSGKKTSRLPRVLGLFIF